MKQAQVCHLRPETASDTGFFAARAIDLHIHLLRDTASLPMTELRKSRPSEATGATSKRRRNERMIVASVLFGMATVLAVAGRDLFWPEAKPPADGGPQATSETQTANPEPQLPSPLIDDDGRAMWASPTSGEPLAWSYLPPGAQIVLALRPAALTAHPEGDKVLAAFGPLGRDAIRAVEQQTGMEFRQIDRLIVGWQLVGDTGELAATLVVYADPSAAPAVIEADSRSGGRAVHRPGRADGPALIVAPAEAMSEIIELAGHPPPLRRDVERMLAQTDGDRLATLIVAPGFLFNEGQDVFAGELARLQRPLSWFLGDGLSAAAISLHWDENFFVEVVATPSLDTSTGRAAEQLAARVAQLPELVERYVVDLDASPYGRRIVARLPAMTRKLATYTRSGFDRDHVLLRCYLPAVAGHNLLMAAELTLAEPPGGLGYVGRSGTTQPGPVAEAVSPRELLRRSTSLRMPRDTLEAALAQLAADVGVEIVILGADLQLDGITKNQSLTIDVENRPAEEILVEILRRANPDKSAAGPDDERQKLVYVVGPQTPGGPDVILITTRARAAERGDTLPSVFLVGE